jgi:hypothetical protein
MQIKTILRHCLTIIRIAIITTQKRASTTIMENSMKFPQKIKHRIIRLNIQPYDPATPLLVVHPKEMKLVC